MRSVLDKINSPADIHALPKAERDQLAEDIRERIRETVGNTGGHLASNLGVVELTIALHSALDCPRDKLLFDVGHQCYAHKLLTGRQAAFERLRCDGGVAGFPKRAESVYDCFGSGHASTAVSAALGFARARDLRGEKHKVAAIIGDGALTGGMAYEALNDAGGLGTQFLVVLNDNEMSISKNVGALEEHLTRLRVSRNWRIAKRAVKGGLDVIPVIGRPVSRALEWIKGKARALLVPGSFFESLGFRYIGPVDGHSLDQLIDTIRSALQWDSPTLLHVVTRKGKGFPEAEAEPEKYHGMPRRRPGSNESIVEGRSSAPIRLSCANTAGITLARLADTDHAITAITAAMPTGTGMDIFKASHPSRFFDVGIAEEHAVTLAAGMAAAGLRPVVALYSTFLQRAADQVMHDVCLQNLAVTFLIDHAGFVARDGATHQGLYDVPMLRALPNLTIWTPSGMDELSSMIEAGVSLGTPCLIRYPKSLPDSVGSAPPAPPGKWRVEREGSRAALLASGACLPIALECAALLESDGIPAAVVRAASVKPLDDDVLRTFADSGVRLVTIEECQRAGSFGSAVAEFCADNDYAPPIIIGVPDEYYHDHSVNALRAASGLTPAAIAQTVRKHIHHET